jgi:hypothetical protein
MFPLWLPGSSVLVLVPASRIASLADDGSTGLLFYGK